jgi:hypothetical protein
MKTTNKIIKLNEKSVLDDIILKEDELLIIKGGLQSVVSCGNNCGSGCGRSCGSGCNGNM